MTKIKTKLNTKVLSFPAQETTNHLTTQTSPDIRHQYEIFGSNFRHLWRKGRIDRLNCSYEHWFLRVSGCVVFTSPCELAILADIGRCRVLLRATEAPYAETAVSARVCRSVTVGPVLLRSSVDLVSSSSGMRFELSKQVKKNSLLWITLLTGGRFYFWGRQDVLSEDSRGSIVDDW